MLWAQRGVEHLQHHLQVDTFDVYLQKMAKEWRLKNDDHNFDDDDVDKDDDVNLRPSCLFFSCRRYLYSLTLARKAEVRKRWHYNLLNVKDEDVEKWDRFHNLLIKIIANVIDNVLLL